MRLLDKLEINIDYPHIISFSDLYIADVSGIDSISALISILESNSNSQVIPTFIDLACEHGDKESEFRRVYQELSAMFNTCSERILPGIVININELWHRIVIRDIQGVIKNFGFYSPCISCHLTFHLTRITLAKRLNVQNVISGEREFHGQKEKINQIGFVLDYFNSIYSESGICHYQPVRHIRDKNEINMFTAKYNIKPVNLKCILSGNYFKPETSLIDIDRHQIENYIRYLSSDPINHVNDIITLYCTLIY